MVRTPVTGRTWLTDSSEVLGFLGIHQEEAFDNFQPAITSAATGVAGARQAVLLRKRVVLLPAASRADYEWFQQQTLVHPVSPWTLPGWASNETLGFSFHLNWGKTLCGVIPEPGLSLAPGQGM